MNFCICSVFIAVLSLQFSVLLCAPDRSCPDFTATFVALADQSIDDLELLIDDSEQTFFKETLGFRDTDIQNAAADAFSFFNETYGLDFSRIPLNEQNQHVLGNATLSLFRFPEQVHYQLAYNNWIQTGSTRFTCRDIEVGGFLVTFSGDQLLRGSYGGEDGIRAGVENFLEYGFYVIDVCDQSPVIIQFETATPIRPEPIDGLFHFNLDLYNRVLGRGKALGVFTLKSDQRNPGEYRLINRLVFTFPAN